MAFVNDTICALATAAGKGGVSVIRVSGSLALSVCQPLCAAKPTPRQAQVCSFRTPGGELIDSGIFLYFQGPNSFTGEDVCELHCHGSPVVVDQLLSALVAKGARLARPGEFSERAFLNGKLDLSQAEAIADLIDSASVAAARHAAHSLRGDFSELIHRLVSSLINVRVYVEAALDFADEDIDFLADGHIREQIQELELQLQAVLAQAKHGSLLREGLRVVIAGAPNVGKSTLLNALCGDDIAIVTPIAGTTRDLLQQSIALEGIPLHITDTAGLHESEDPVELEGIRRARGAIKNADLVLYVADVSSKLAVQNDALFQELRTLTSGNLSVVFNKIDLLKQDPGKSSQQDVPAIHLSAQTRAGLSLLREHIKHQAGFNAVEDGGFIARRRHLLALEEASLALTRSLDCLDHARASELAAEELRKAQQALDTITGKFSNDDLLGAIFSSFCIGK